MSSILRAAINKVLPTGARGRLLAKLVFRFVRSPRAFLWNLNMRNIKAFFFYLRTTDAPVLENLVDVKLRTYKPERARGIIAHFPDLGEESIRQKKIVILIADDRVPEHDKYAGALTIYQYTRLFHDMGFKVVFLPDDLQKREPYTSEMQRNGIDVIWGEKFEFDSWIQANGRYIAVAWLSRPHVGAKYIDKLRKHSQALILYYTVDLHHLRLERQYKIDRNMNILKEAQRLKKLEFGMFRKADVIITPSDTERDIISTAFPDKFVQNIPGWIFKNVPPKKMKVSYDDRRDVMFLGGFGHLPNVDAATWFVNEVFPHVSRELPDVRLFIIGSDPPKNIKALASTSIIVTGYVEDLTPYLGKTRVFVAPLRYGAGIKGKIVTSMSYGVPVVTTTIGSEGLGVVHGEDCLIADDPVQFAHAVVKLYTDRSLWEKLSKNAITLARENFSEQAARKELMKILAQIDIPYKEAA